MSRENREFIKHNRTILLEKLKESLSSVLPVTAVVFILCFIFFPADSGIMLTFIIGAVMLILGMGLFTLGADIAMMPIGEHVGSSITKSRKLWLIIIASLIIGTAVTVSEPSLTVLAQQVPGIPDMVLILTVSLGVGLFLTFSMLRVIFRIKLAYVLMGVYAVIFTLSFFAPKEFLSLAFDSGGASTGAMTVPFLLAFGAGAAAVRSDKDAHSDSFGFVGLSAAGPILAVLLLGILYKPGNTTYEATAPVNPGKTTQITRLFITEIPGKLGEVALAILPIVVCFLIFQLAVLKLKKGQVIRIVVGLVYAYVGLVLFLTGANVGFLQMGSFLGKALGSLPYNWIVIPIGMVIGYFLVISEPAVHVLSKQVVELSSGAIPKKAIATSLSVGVATSIGLCMIKILTSASILYFVIPGYVIGLILTFFVPPVFTSIAIDSGAVSSGPMASTFLVPFAIGVCLSVGGNIIVDAFGIIALVTMTPFITIQVLGLFYRFKLKAAEREQEIQQKLKKKESIINF
ncbi:MAG: hypothetical protein BWX78_00099 [Firmicutes bacterium ADurb.Bin099]|nr:MAG: hypothetical protein BWX78_00099 [Firmicutes bacterium ADurb.Bin099]